MRQAVPEIPGPPAVVRRGWEPGAERRVSEAVPPLATAGTMDCRKFRKSHLAFTDGTLSNSRSAAMYGHLEECERCARFDNTVRRALLVARNLPDIEPSPAFARRLAVALGSGGLIAEPLEPTRTLRRTAIRAGVVAAVALGGLAAAAGAQRGRATSSKPGAAHRPLAVSHSTAR